MMSTQNEIVHGYINKEGCFVIAPEYDDAFEFRDGLAHVVYRKCGRSVNAFLGLSGELAFDVDERFTECHSFGEAYA